MIITFLHAGIALDGRIALNGQLNVHAHEPSSMATIIYVFIEFGCMAASGGVVQHGA